MKHARSARGHPRPRRGIFHTGAPRTPPQLHRDWSLCGRGVGVSRTAAECALILAPPRPALPCGQVTKPGRDLLSTHAEASRAREGTEDPGPQRGTVPTDQTRTPPLCFWETKMDFRQRGAEGARLDRSSLVPHSLNRENERHVGPSSRGTPSRTAHRQRAEKHTRGATPHAPSKDTVPDATGSLSAAHAPRGRR